MKSFVIASALSLLPVLSFAETPAMDLEGDTPEQQAPATPVAEAAAPAPVAVPTPAPVATPAPVVKPAAVVAPPKGKTNFVIRQNIKSHKLIVIEASGSPITLSIGKVFLVNFEDGQQCSVVVKEITGNLISADTAICDRADQITTKLAVEPALVDTPVVAAPAVAPIPTPTPALPVNEQPAKSMEQPYARLAINVYYSSADKVKFDDAYASLNSGSGNLDASFETDKALGIGVSIGRMQQNGWGFNFLGAIEGAREVKTVTYTGAGGTVTGTLTGTRPKFAFLIGEAQMLYRWDQFYLPFGLNLSSAWITDYVGEIEVRGGIGAVLGVGCVLTDHVAIELMYRSIGIYMKEKDGTEYIDYKYGSLSGASFGFKYIF